uniref:Uncharacterized protein n=1 Tax=Panagrellus redivivus TaxID=6233 RepID=A0A7E4URE1_PANRE
MAGNGGTSWIGDHGTPVGSSKSIRGAQLEEELPPTMCRTPAAWLGPRQARLSADSPARIKAQRQPRRPPLDPPDDLIIRGVRARQGISSALRPYAR